MSGDLEIIATGAATLPSGPYPATSRCGPVPSASLRATTTSGDIFVAGLFDGAGPYTIETVSGDLVLAPANDIRVEVGTITGDLTERRRRQARRRRQPARPRDGPRRADGRGSARHRATSASPGRQPLLGTGAPTPVMPPTTADSCDATHATHATDPLRRPPTPASASPTVVVASSSTPLDDTIESAWLAVLRALERGEIDVAEAGRRLERLESASRRDAARRGALRCLTTPSNPSCASSPRAA